ncbi:hypothetical protein CC1G_11844 [Coprinopsis cinerea okayama7|uniref:PPPDE domain-containing protein n=1 Tax=Coprinopsis cinerea (strain Okayama-7 / 130 / ATCC MYA-4618 / FGSC 9003) TaxID=240176 RepID=A8PH10_COPC7|nr:hypothetical protein CC1G_11844 [Coprinopsis cinerea okayama7\|eukprot:XP_001841316.2 hypothetical protein CC1G_11844 [Coprinopsis cinerea okayama7\
MTFGSLRSSSSNNNAATYEPKPSVIPEGPVDKNCAEHRPVLIGTLRLQALRGIFPKGTPFKYLMGLFGSKPSLPSPTEHWAVVVGGYYHELVIKTGNAVGYENGEAKNLDELRKQNWQFYEIDGITAFNDAAIYEAAKESIEMMPQPYDLWKNNCQTFVINLLNKICLPGRKLVLTSQGNREEHGVDDYSASDEAEKLMDDKTQHIRTAKELAKLLNYYEPGTVVDMEDTAGEDGSA